MASATESTKTLCFLCDQGKGIYKCEGCSKVFCSKHTADHRDELNRQFEEIMTGRDLLHEILIDQVEHPQQHSLMEKINEWEQSAVEKIHQAADKMRNEALEITVQHTAQMTQNLQILSNELSQGGKENDFTEIDLGQWKQKLEKIQREILNPVAIFIQEDSKSLVNNIRITRQDMPDVFERVFAAAEIKENGCLVVKGIPPGHTEIRGKREYSTGIYKIRSKVEQLNGWIFFGIISKSQSMQSTSYNSPSSYGWSNQNNIYLGVSGQGSTGPTLEIIQNDVVVLTINCDLKKVALKNERLNRTIELSVDINKCPFPWQFHLNLHAANTRVRILNTPD